MKWFEHVTTRTSAIPFALDAAGNWRDVSEVERGLACNCVCPECSGRVQARKGEIRAHYFAHHDLRECRHALEASIFGMVVELLIAPGATIRLPGHGDSWQWLREEKVSTPPPFFSPPFVLAPEVIEASQGFQTGCHRIADSIPDRADLIAEEHHLAIHLLSHRKPYARREELAVPAGWRVLAINLNRYVRLWWDTCDEDRACTVATALQARDHLRRWLADSPDGRGFLQHPAEEEVRKKFQLWAAERRAAAASLAAIRAERITVAPPAPADLAAMRAAQAARAAAKKEADAKWTIPATLPGIAADAIVYQVTTERAVGIVASSLAHEIGLKWHIRLRRYVYPGKPGDVVREGARIFLAPDGCWVPLTSADKLV